ncbi:MAG: glycosyltransferase family 39 protein [Chloroflexi bacterium]|nr:glycosyltransferase family 39 protein [Chloroflexota bacterium]
MPKQLDRLLGRLSEHRHFLIVLTLLTLVATFPTIVHVFRTDIFWHPGGEHPDSFIKLWDVWYGNRFLRGQADRFYTDLMFYPDGVSLVYHPFLLPHIVIVNALSPVLPLPSAYSLAHLLIIWSSALSAYVYLLWLFKDKWISLFGAIVFGFSPHVVGHPYHPDIAAMATVPLTLFCLHRGVKEDRLAPVVLAGLLTGLTTVISLYMYICVLILLGFFLCAFAKSRWRERRFWLCVMLLGLSIAFTSLWRIVPLMSNSQSLGTAIDWHGVDEINSDALSFFVNYSNPLYGRLFESIVETSNIGHISTTSFLGFLPLALIGAGLFKTVTRRKMLPWVFLCAFFLILRLGSHLNVKGSAFADILLPKYYLDQIAPSVFGAFWEVDNFMMGALLPFAVLACFGLVALQKRYDIAAKPKFIVALALLVAFEYYIPIETDRVFPVGDGAISEERLAFLDWLDQEDSESIRLVNLPMGRRNSKLYNLYQLLSGFPHAEGAISRTPESAFSYIRGNPLLKAWHNQQPVSCDLIDRQTYLRALAQLEADGFSHVVYHQEFRDWLKISDSFRYLIPAYRDEFVSIFRLSGLRAGCSEEASARRAFTREYGKALQGPSVLDERTGTVVVFAPTAQAADHFLRYLPKSATIGRTVLAIAGDESANIDIRGSDAPGLILPGALDKIAALWLVNNRLAYDARQSAAYQDWFTERFRFCARYYDEAQITIDLYLRRNISCAAIDDSSAFEVRYDDGLRLQNLSFVFESDTLWFYMAWTNPTSDTYAFSLQIFDQDGNKRLQQDTVVSSRQLLQVVEIDGASLPAGAYSVQLIAYDFETQISQGGTVFTTGERFERELEVAIIELERE